MNNIISEMFKPIDPQTLRDITTYGLAIRHAIGQTLFVDGLIFHRLFGTHKYDAVMTGETSDVFEMEGTRKQYRITITPLMETHGRKK